MFHHVLVLNYYAAFGGFRTDIRMVDARVHAHTNTLVLSGVSRVFWTRSTISSPLAISLLTK
jgi:hypothetical protein